MFGPVYLRVLAIPLMCAAAFFPMVCSEFPWPAGRHRLLAWAIYSLTEFITSL